MSKVINVGKLSGKKQVKAYAKMVEALSKAGYGVSNKDESAKLYEVVCVPGAELEIKDKVYSNFYGNRIMAGMHSVKGGNRVKLS